MDGWRNWLREQGLVIIPAGLLLGVAIAVILLRLSGLDALSQLPDQKAFSDASLLSMSLAGAMLLLASGHQRRWCCHAQTLLALGILLLSTYSWLMHAGLMAGVAGLSYSSTNSALGFALGAVAFLLLQYLPERAPISAALLALLMCMLAALGFVGLVLGFDPLFGWSTAVHMTGYTAGAILLFATGIAALAWRQERERPHSPTQRLLLLVTGVLTITVIVGSLVVYVVAVTHLQWQAEERIQLVLNERVDHLQLQLERTLRRNQVLAAQLQLVDTRAQVEELLAKSSEFDYVAIRGKGITLSKGQPLQPSTMPPPLPVATAPATLLYQRGSEFYLRMRRPVGGWAMTTELELPMDGVFSASQLSGPRSAVYLCAPISPIPDGALRCMSQSAAAAGETPELIRRVMQLALAGERGSGLFVEQQRRDVFLAYESRLGVGLVVEQDAAELYTALHRDLSLTLPFLLLLLLASGGMIIWRLLPLTQALRTSEERFRDLVESSSDWVWEVNARGVYTYASPMVMTLLGYEPHEVIGKPPFAFMPPEEAALIAAEFQAIAIAAKPFSGLININRHKQGHLVTLETSGVPFFDGRGQLAGYRGVDRDISGRKAMEERLARSEAHYRLLADNATDMISLHDVEGRYRYVSPACRNLLGYEPQELLGHDAYEFIHPDDFAAVRKSHDTVLGTPERYRVLYRLRRKDGTYVWVESNSVILQADDPAQGEILVVSRDMTQQRQNEEALRKSEQMYRSVVSALSEGVVVHEMSGRILSVNEAACSILGRTHPQMLGLDSSAPTWDAVRGDDTPFPGEDHPAMITLRTGVPQRDIVMGVMRPDNSRVWLSINSEPLPGASGQGLSGVVASFTDITARRRAEQELMASRERLRALSAHLQQLQEEERAQLARELHDELGSIMTALKMDMTWVMGQLSCCEEVLREKMASMTRLLDSAVRTVRHIVTELRPTILDDMGLWAALDWLAEEFSRHSGIAVRRDIACTDLQVPPDVGLAIFRLLQEALTNVAKHASATEVRIDCWCSPGLLHIMLEDNGIGLSEARASDVTSHGIRSMEERVTQLGGAIEFHGSEAEGTLIYVKLPLLECGGNEDD